MKSAQREIEELQVCGSPASLANRVADKCTWFVKDQLRMMKEVLKQTPSDSALARATSSTLILTNGRRPPTLKHVIGHFRKSKSTSELSSVPLQLHLVISQSAVAQSVAPASGPQKRSAKGRRGLLNRQRRRWVRWWMYCWSCFVTRSRVLGSDWCWRCSALKFDLWFIYLPSLCLQTSRMKRGGNKIGGSSWYTSSGRF